MAYEIQKFKEKIPTINSNYEVVKVVETITEANLELEQLRKKAEEEGTKATYGWREIME